VGIVKCIVPLGHPQTQTADPSLKTNFASAADANGRAVTFFTSEIPRAAGDALETANLNERQFDAIS
jgi:hypothetical protein